MLRLSSLLPALLLCSALAATPAAPNRAPVTLPPAQEARVLDIQRNLRCPLCDTGESIAESRSDISVKMRASVREQVARGQSDAQIYDFFAARYGNFVLLDPPKQGRNLWLWGAPLIALAGGAAALWGFLRRSRAGAAQVGEVNPEVYDPYLEQVRRETHAPGTPERDA